MLRALARSVAAAAGGLSRPTVRGLASATEETTVSPAMRLFGVEGRYAHALYSAAAKSKNLEKVEEELHFVRDVVVSQSAFRRFLEDPGVSRVTKRDTLMSALRELKLSDTTVNFFGVIAENGRTREISSIVGGFDKLMDSHRGVVNATVTHAGELTPAVEATAKSIIARMVPAGTEPKIKYTRDDELLGGVVVRVADSVVDQSMQTELERLYEHLDREITPEEVAKLRG